MSVDAVLTRMFREKARFQLPVTAALDENRGNVLKFCTVKRLVPGALQP